MKIDLIEKGVGLILKGLEVDPTDRNFLETPERYAKFLQELFDNKDTEYATFPEEYTDFILLRQHKMYSLCPHHLLAVEFLASVAYIPNGQVLGLSKLARVLDDANDGPLLQELFTRRVLELLKKNCVGIQGVACLISGQHECLKIRGVKSDARFITYKLEGKFKEDTILADRFFRLCGV